MNRTLRVSAGLLVAAAFLLPTPSSFAATLTPGAAAGPSLMNSRLPGGPLAIPPVSPDGNGNGGKNGDGGNGGDGGDGGNGDNSGDGWNGWNGGDRNNGNGGDDGNSHCGQGVHCSGAPALGWPLLVIGFGGAALTVVMRRRRDES